MFLIPIYEIEGAAIATGIASTLYNFMKFIYIWKKFGMQPYAMHTVKTIVIIGTALFVGIFMAFPENPWLAIACRGLLITLLFISLSLYFKIVPEYHHLVKRYLQGINNFKTSSCWVSIALLNWCEYLYSNQIVLVVLVLLVVMSNLQLMKTDLKSNIIYNELLELGIIDASSINFLSSGTRSKWCWCFTLWKSGVIFLDRSDHVGATYYEAKSGTSYWSSEDRAAGLKETAIDDVRRASQIKDYVLGKKFADVGSGLGGILDLVKPFAKEIVAVEPQNDIRSNLTHIGYNTLASIKELAEQKQNLISFLYFMYLNTSPILWIH